MKNKKSPQYYIILLSTKIQIILDIRPPDLVKKLELNGCTQDFAQTFESCLFHSVQECLLGIFFITK